MKPIHVNLASRPFRDYRPLYAVVVVAAVLIAFLMLNNVDTYYRYVRDTEQTRAEISRIERQIQQERRRADVSAAQVRRIDLAALGKQTRFINTQLAERAFSWSELLDRLEDVMPKDVRITSIAPRFDDNGTVELNMQCEAKAANGMIKTLSRFQQSSHFARPFPSSQNNIGTAYAFGLTVQYRPSIPRVVSR